MSAETRITELGLELPAPPRAMGSYVILKTTGNLAFTAGHGPIRADGSFITGRVGEDMDVEEAKEVARYVGLEILATLRQELGSLDRVTAVVKVVGFVNATPEFESHPAVINGCSDLFVEIFGEAGKHARSAVGVPSLPAGIAVEIEAIFEYE